MAGMAAILQRVDDEQLEPGQPRRRFRAEIADIGAIGKITDAEAQRNNAAMLLRQGFELNGAACPVNDERLAVLDQMSLEDRGIGAALGGLKTIAEAFEQPRLRRQVGMNIDQTAAIERVAANIVDAVNMISMGVGIDDR